MIYKIYQIINWITGDKYIGITTQELRTRLIHHKSKKKCNSKFILEGIYTIELLEQYEGEKYDAYLKEREYIDNCPEAVNTMKSVRTIQEKQNGYNYNGKHQLEHYYRNRDKILEKRRKSHIINAEIYT